MQSNTNSSVQVECLWSDSLEQGSNCTDSVDPNVTSVYSNGDLVLAELIASVLQGKDFGEEIQDSKTTGLGQEVVPRLCECCRQSQAEVVRKSINKIHQTCGPPFSQAL